MFQGFKRMITGSGFFITTFPVSGQDHSARSREAGWYVPVSEGCVPVRSGGH
jgi:hypothetical protein